MFFVYTQNKAKLVFRKLKKQGYCEVYLEIMWAIIKISGVIFAALVNLLLGLLVLARNSKNKINRVFFLACLCFTLWSFCLLFYEFPLVFSSIFWIKATYTIVSVLQVLVLAFSFIFPTDIFRRVWIWAGFFCIFFLSLTTWLLFFTRTWIIGVVVDPEKGLQTLLGSNYITWIFLIIACYIWALINFFVRSRRSSGRQKMQLQYLFYGIGFWGIFITIVDGIIPLFFHDTRYFSLSPVCCLFFSTAIAYSILKHRLMDIRLVLARTVSYTLLSLIIVTFYTASLFIISHWLFPTPLNGGQLIISIVLALLVAYTFSPLKNFLEKVTVKVFFREHYEVEELLEEISEVLSKTLDLNQLIKNSLGILLSTMHIDRGGVFLVQKNSTKRGISYDSNNQMINNIKPIEMKMKMLLKIKEEMVVFDDLEEGGLKEFMRKNQLGILAKLYVKKGLIGILFLGQKLSGDIYTNDDVQVLEILDPQLAVAIQNAQRYEEIKQFSEKLKTEIKKATDDLQIANRKLKELDKMKDEFLSVAAHELRAPMSAIKGYLSMILEGDAGKISTKATQFLQEASEGNERLIRLVNNMLNVSRIEEGRMVYQMGVVGLGKVAQTVFDEFKLEAQNKDLEISLKILPGLKDQVYVDQDRIHEVVANFISNAIKYTDKGSVTLRLLQPRQTVVRFEVIDTGAGISQKDQKKLFQKFTRTESATGKSLGTGLGLYIAKLLIKRFGGKIGFNSEVGKGSTFWFELNGCKAHSEGIAAAPTEPSG